jgi:hypothetical protein
VDERRWLAWYWHAATPTRTHVRGRGRSRRPVAVRFLDGADRRRSGGTEELGARHGAFCDVTRRRRPTTWLGAAAGQDAAAAAADLSSALAYFGLFGSPHDLWARPEWYYRDGNSGPVPGTSRVPAPMGLGMSLIFQPWVRDE